VGARGLDNLVNRSDVYYTVDGVSWYELADGYTLESTPCGKCVPP